MTQFEQSNQPLDQLALELASRPVGLSAKIGRAAQILKHYRSSQIAQRIFNVAIRKLQRGKVVGAWKLSGDLSLQFGEPVKKLAEVIVRHHREHPSHSRCDLEKGKYVLLNHCVGPGQWPTSDELNKQAHLWRFQFQYHEFLLTFAANGAWSQVGEFLLVWLSKYDPATTKQSDDSWHPYCISRRIAAWVWLLSLSEFEGGELGENLTCRLEQSLAHQANYLSHNLEWDLGGNHLIENATALAIAGAVVKTKVAARWRQIARQVLESELPKQVRSNGEHFELSPMYHCQILSNFLRIEICDSEFKELLGPYSQTMLEFVNSILHPDGEIPLWGDSVFYEAPSVDHVREVALLADLKVEPGKPMSAMSRTGNIFVFRSGQNSVLCDFEQIAATHLPAHGHCDALSIELSVDQDRWIVDSGNFNYSNDSMRHYCRSSIGHNVVTVDNENQANVWSMFRMGRRPKVFGQRDGSQGQWRWASATHDGFAQSGVKSLSRLIATHENTVVCVDWAAASRSCQGKELIGYLHFHPDVQIRKLMKRSDSDGSVFALACGATKRHLELFAGAATIERGWYCDQFGQRRLSPVVRYVTTLPTCATGWILKECDKPVGIEFQRYEVEITMGGTESLTWAPV